MNGQPQEQITVQGLNAYQRSLISLNECFQELISALIAYQSHKQYEQLDYGLITLWTSSKGISNLVKILSLGLNHNDDRANKIKIQTKEDKQMIQSFSEESQPVKKQCKVEDDSVLVFHPEEQGSENFIPEKKQKIKKSYVRGPYKNYTAEQKMQAVKLLMQKNVSVSQISRQLHIPCKNIKRWALQGTQRKKGGGRKRFNPQMQDLIYHKLCQLPTRQIRLQAIQNIALQLSEDNKFKASRGWTIKFIERYNIREQFIII